MKNIRGWFVATTISFALCAFTSNKAVADTYQVVPLITDNNGVVFAGMDDSGHVSFLSPNAPPPTGSYFNFLNGVFIGTSLTAPTFIQDNGTPCTPSLPPGASMINARCNNGREAFLGFLTSGQEVSALYEGPPFTLVSDLGRDNFLAMNANGDIVFNDPFFENWDEAIDLTTRATPEPSSLLLLGTGVVMLVQSVRRRAINRWRRTSLD